MFKYTIHTTEKAHGNSLFRYERDYWMEGAPEERITLAEKFSRQARRSVPS
jgi:hypothetical protein